MKVVFENIDDLKVKRLAKSDDMAQFIFELHANVWRQFNNTNYNYLPYQEAVYELMQSFNIDPEDLIE